VKEAFFLSSFSASSSGVLMLLVTAMFPYVPPRLFCSVGLCLEESHSFLEGRNRKGFFGFTNFTRAVSSSSSSSFSGFLLCFSAWGLYKWLASDSGSYVIPQCTKGCFF